jgi:signal transduction histidine kinase
VQGRWPAEVQPLVTDLNAVLDANAAILERARTQTGNLAHALKTPLAVIGNAAAALPPAEAALIAEQAERMRRQVELHLVRARAAAIAHTRGPGTPLRAALDAVLRSLARLHADKGLAFEVRGETTAPFRGELQDLQEMLGNLLDNAAQWARGRVDVTLAERGGHLLLTIDDDGPGIPAAERARVLQRGERLDEQPAGAGLGLAIAGDLARLYGGSLALDDSPQGGLRAVLELPAAPPFESTVKE